MGNSVQSSIIAVHGRGKQWKNNGDFEFVIDFFQKYVEKVKSIITVDIRIPSMAFCLIGL